MGRVRWISTIRRFRVPLWRHDEKVSRQNSLMNLENLVRNLISSNYQFQKKKSRYEIYLKWYFFFQMRNLQWNLIFQQSRHLRDVIVRKLCIKIIL